MHSSETTGAIHVKLHAAGECSGRLGAAKDRYSRRKSIFEYLYGSLINPEGLICASSIRHHPELFCFVCEAHEFYILLPGLQCVAFRLRQ